jgi:hypothetical protein
MRILITPNYPHHYDQRMVEGLASGFRALDCAAHALPSPINDIEAAAVCRQLDIDVLIQVNRFRPIYNPLPEKVRHVAWFQDIFPATTEIDVSRFRAGDIVYALGDPGVLGLNMTLPCQVGTLLTAVDEGSLSLYTNTPRVKSVDFSLCGYIPAPIKIVRSPRQDLIWFIKDTIRRTPLIGRPMPMRLFWRYVFKNLQETNFVPYAIAAALRGTVEGLYQPLRGDLDIHELATAMRQVVAPVLTRSRRSQQARPKPPKRSRLGFIMAPYEGVPFGLQPEIEILINYFAREYPRLLDRRLLVQNALLISKNVQLYGDGWQNHDEFRPYSKGFIVAQRELLDVYSRSRLNLMNNTHGIGLHSRTLECMAVGGFIFTHTSPHDNKPGGIETSFEPGVHYGIYSADTFADDARRWLAATDARTDAGTKAAEIIREKHLWRHRAEQVIADLKR